MYSTMSPIEMPSTTSIESTSYTLKLNANSHKVFNHITNWTKISNAFHNQMPVAAPASAFAWPSSGESVAVRIGGISMEFAAVRGWLLAGTRVCCGRCRRTDVGMPCQRQQAPEDGLRISRHCDRRQSIQVCGGAWWDYDLCSAEKIAGKIESDHDFELPLWVAATWTQLCHVNCLCVRLIKLAYLLTCPWLGRPTYHSFPYSNVSA